MKNTRFIFLMLIALTTVGACSPGVKKKTDIADTKQVITRSNIKEAIGTRVKHFDREPVYKLNVQNGYCFFELLVNDIPVFRNFHKPVSASATRINHTIWKSGPQKVTYRMYPAGQMEGSAEQYNTLRGNSYLKFTLASYDKNNPDAGDTTYVDFSTPGNPGSDGDALFEGAGRTYYEGSFTIDVNVPYSLSPAFETARDLRKSDPKELEARLVKAYTRIWEVYRRKDLDAIARLSFETLSVQMASEYAREEYIAATWEEMTGIVSDPSFTLQPLADYKLVFYANGRLAALESAQENSDFKGMPVLWAQVKHNGEERPLFFKTCFYLPAGQHELLPY